MARAKYGDTVKVHYTGRLDDGTVFDASINGEPLQFTIGSGQIIPGFEQAVVGMNPGESKTVKIPAEDAYGQRREDLIIEVEKSQLPEGLKPEVGLQLQSRQPDGRIVVLTIADITESHVTLDANHPLAGKDLTFEIQLVEII